MMGAGNEGKILISEAKSCLCDLLQIAWKSLLEFHWGVGRAMNEVKYADEMGEYDVISQLSASLLMLMYVGLQYIWKQKASSGNLPWFGADWDWSDFWISRQRDRSGWWLSETGDTVTAADNQTQIGASGYHHSVHTWAFLLPPVLYHNFCCHGTLFDHKSTNCSLQSISTVCHHLSLLC